MKELLTFIFLMEITSFILFGIACFALGMYFASQIENWINNNTKNKKNE
tara:strand:- start:201 stop:347 length:147 start_codon:yes stop_codon:yes gene_type:complete